ncbi:MAG TPA: PEPxxWA-CTERM sorting domain-containing protein [Sphingomicrobium sp.]|nr:PEPxxWA-CTERM sorting domain-containing protein [Sphingomicrobium sp.]
MLASATAAQAAVTDPVDDLLGTYTGPANADLDIVSADVAFDGTSFFLSTTMDGTIGTTAGSLFVWGVDRGSGAPRLTFGSPSVGAGILFDAVIVMFPDGTLRVVTIPLAGAPTINQFAGGTAIDGNALSATVDAALLGSMGFAPEDYTFSLWSRARVNPALDGTNAEIADFLASSGSMHARAVPEPATWLMMLLGFGVSGAMIRRRRSSSSRFRQLA